EQLQLFWGQCLIVAEVPVTFYGAPWRHPAFENFFFDGSSPWKCIFIRGHGERAPAITMAGDAAGIKNTRNLAVPGHRRRYDVVRFDRDAGCDNGYRNGDCRLEVGDFEVGG